jgi:LacI family transcriptional regulator
LLIVTSGSDGRRLKMIQESGIPVVALDRPLTGLQADAVLVENREGAEQGVRHLIKHGHKKIACVGFDSGSYTVRERIEGYNFALRSAGLQPILFTNLNSLEAMQAVALRWSNAKDQPTAAFSLKRISSVYLIQALHLHKLRIPEDIAVVGCDDFELAEVLGTPMTVVRQTPTGMARSAAELPSASAIAMPAPSPRDEPVTSAVFPFRLNRSKITARPSR